jgi:hypothetical protein
VVSGAAFVLISAQQEGRAVEDAAGNQGWIGLWAVVRKNNPPWKNGLTRLAVTLLGAILEPR